MGPGAAIEFRVCSEGSGGKGSHIGWALMLGTPGPGSFTQWWQRGREAHLQDVMEGGGGTPVCRGLFLEGHWGGRHGQSNIV